MTNSDQKPGSGPVFVTVSADKAGKRIDNFLMAHARSAPKTLIYKILRKGEVRVNKGRVKPSYRVEEGDVVRIPPIRLPETESKAVPGRSILERIDRSIIYEDEGILVLNKPSGVAVHGGSGVSFGVIEALRALRPKQEGLELVHRLDRDTSGCLIIAKKRSALRKLHESMRAGHIGKRYLALCQGQWKRGARDVEAPLKKNVQSSGERIVRVDAEGKEAKSRFTPVRRFRDATLMEVELYTGRTHQIRVHAQFCGHPLAGDGKYGDRDFNKAMAVLGLKRLFLHAYKLSFPWPEAGQVLEVSAPLDDELEIFLDQLPKKT